MKQIKEIKKLGKEGLQLAVANSALALILASIVKKTEQLGNTIQTLIDGRVR